MAKLFGLGVSVIPKHLKNIIDRGELVVEVVISILETTGAHGDVAGLPQTQQGKFCTKQSSRTAIKHFVAQK